MMMANNSFLVGSTKCSLLILVIGLSILPAAWCQYCNTVDGEPKISISSTPSSNYLAIGTTVNLTCTAWQTDDMARNPRTKPYRIEWFDPQDRRVGGSCHAGFPVASLMRCTLMVGALTDENLGNYTCRARNAYNYCSTKRFEIKLRAPEVTVHCENQYMTIVVAKALVPGVDRGHLGLRNSSCLATETTTYFSLTTQLDGCLTSASETPTSLIYSNNVLKIPSEVITNGAVTRQKQVVIPFSCQYSKSGMVSSAGWKPEINVVEFNVAGRGNFNMTLNMFADSDFDTPYSQKDMPVAVKVQQPLFFEVSVLTGASQLSISAHRCYATPTQHHNGSVEYNFIQNGCPADESTHFLSTNSESGAQRFTTTAFQFTGDHPFVFIHCHVVICDRNDSLSECRKTCPSSNGRLRKREVHDHLIDGYSLGQGPVYLVRSKRELDGNESRAFDKNGLGSGLAIDIMVVLALICAVCLTATVLMFIRKYRQEQQADSGSFAKP